MNVSKKVAAVVPITPEAYKDIGVRDDTEEDARRRLRTMHPTVGVITTEWSEGWFVDDEGKQHHLFAVKAEGQVG